MQRGRRKIELVWKERYRINDRKMRLRRAHIVQRRDADRMTAAIPKETKSHDKTSVGYVYKSNEQPSEASYFIVLLILALRTGGH